MNTEHDCEECHRPAGQAHHDWCAQGQAHNSRDDVFPSINTAAPRIRLSDRDLISGITGKEFSSGASDTANGRIKALEDALRTKAAMIELGEKIAWGSDVALMREAADALAAIQPAADCHQPDLVTAQPAKHVQPGAPVTLTYTNWKGETAERAIIPRRVWWGSTEWHPEPQWLLTAFDVDKQAERDFALKDFCQPVQPVAVKVKPLAWTATCDAGDFMAYDPLFERQVLSLEPAAYDTERVDRIMAALDVQPMTVQDAARVVADGLNDGEVWCVAVNGAAAILSSGMPESYWPPVKRIREALDAALRAIAEGRA